MTMRSTNDLVRIASAGGGMAIDAGMRQTNDLVRIASAASNHPGTRIFLGGLSMRDTNDLVRIASAGKGAVVFQDI